MSSPVGAASWPRVEVTLHPDGTAEVAIGGSTRTLHIDNIDDARPQIIALIAKQAAELGRPLHAITRDPNGDEWPIIIYPDGTATDDTHIPRRSSLTSLTPQALVQQPVPLPEPVSTTQPRKSFLTHEHREEPASKGWRGLLVRLGIRIGPSETERAERADVAAVSQHWPGGARTISIVNSKGGAGKTPSTVLLAAVFARHHGAGVLAWDNNQTRGTLGWRSEQGPHDATLLDLLPRIDGLLSPSAQAAELARFVHHQTRDKFDVLRSKPTALAHEQRVEPEDVDAIHAVASKYYRLIFMDSGNDESDPMWLRMIDHTDQLVVSTTTRDDHAEAGALLLEALAARDDRSARLADQAVVIVTQADSKATPQDLARVADGYRAIAREAVCVPYDPAMVDGLLQYGALRPKTQRAWLSAAAAVARGL